MEIQFGELVTGVGLLGPDFFDPKLTRLAHLLSFASLFDSIFLYFLYRGESLLIILFYLVHLRLLPETDWLLQIVKTKNLYIV